MRSFAAAVGIFAVTAMAKPMLAKREYGDAPPAYSDPAPTPTSVPAYTSIPAYTSVPAETYPASYSAPASSAVPSAPAYGECDGSDGAAPCLTLADAQEIADHFIELQVDYTDAAADEYLSVDFTDYTDSVIELINSGCNGPIPVSLLFPT